jgi:hypothetical protein
MHHITGRAPSATAANRARTLASMKGSLMPTTLNLHDGACHVGPALRQHKATNTSYHNITARDTNSARKHGAPGVSHRKPENQAADAAKAIDADVDLAGGARKRAD